MGQAAKKTPPLTNQKIFKQNLKSENRETIKQEVKKTKLAIVLLGDFQA
jgi:hypothetical protein